MLLEEHLAPTHCVDEVLKFFCSPVIPRPTARLTGSRHSPQGVLFVTSELIKVLLTLLPPKVRKFDYPIKLEPHMQDRASTGGHKRSTLYIFKVPSIEAAHRFS